MNLCVSNYLDGQFSICPHSLGVQGKGCYVKVHVVSSPKISSANSEKGSYAQEIFLLSDDLRSDMKLGKL